MLTVYIHASVFHCNNLISVVS